MTTIVQRRVRKEMRGTWFPNLLEKHPCLMIFKIWKHSEAGVPKEEERWESRKNRQRKINNSPLVENEH